MSVADDNEAHVDGQHIVLILDIDSTTMQYARDHLILDISQCNTQETI